MLLMQQERLTKNDNSNSSPMPLPKNVQVAQKIKKIKNKITDEYAYQQNPGNAHSREQKLPSRVTTEDSDIIESRAVAGDPGFNQKLQEMLKNPVDRNKVTEITHQGSVKQVAADRNRQHA